MRCVRFSFLLLLLSLAAPASAAVEVHFYSKDFASSFPHAFVRLTGTLDSTGEKVDTNFGFTPVRLSPAILAGPVKGMIQTVSPKYVSRSDRHFTLQLTEEQYRTVLGTVEKWRSAPQPSYRLNSANCVYFVADVAAALGLRAEPDLKLNKKPKSWLRVVTQENAAMIAQWNSAMPPAAIAPAGH